MSIDDDVELIEIKAQCKELEIFLRMEPTINNQSTEDKIIYKGKTYNIITNDNKI